MRKLLVVTYHFPPDASVGGRRPAQFARRLPSLGWQPVVLTVDPKYYRQTDETDQVPGVRAERTTMLPSLEAVYRACKRRLSSPPRDDSPQDVPVAAARARRKRSFLRDFALALMYLPDEFVSWVPAAVARSLKMTAAEHFDAMLTTSPPNSVHLTGAALHAATGLPWLADLRDPWLSEAHPDYRRTRFARLVNTLLERLALGNADRIVAVTDEMTRLYRETIGGGERRFATVYNGFDRMDLPPTEPTSSHGGPLTITYTGSMYHSRDPRALFEAAARLIADGKAGTDDLRFEFIGNCAMTPSGPIDQLIQANDLADCVYTTGWLPHREAVERLLLADVALLPASKQRLQIPAKAFEYIAMAKPILALTEPDSATGRLISSAGCGVVVDQEDVDGLEQALDELLEQKRCGRVKLSPNAEYIKTLDVRNQVKRLAGLLDDML